MQPDDAYDTGMTLKSSPGWSDRLEHVNVDLETVKLDMPGPHATQEAML